MALEQKQGLNDRKNKVSMLQQTKKEISEKEKLVNELIQKLNTAIKESSEAEVSLEW